MISYTNFEDNSQHEEEIFLLYQLTPFGASQFIVN